MYTFHFVEAEDGWVVTRTGILHFIARQANGLCRDLLLVRRDLIIAMTR